MSNILGLEHEAGWFTGIVMELHAAGLPLSQHSNAYEAGRQFKSGPGILFGFTVYSSNAAAQFIQVHDLQVAPATGAIPAVTLTVKATDNLAVSYIFPGRFFQRGIWIGNSSTGPTYTAGSADCFFDAQYV